VRDDEDRARGPGVADRRSNWFAFEVRTASAPPSRAQVLWAYTSRSFYTGFALTRCSRSAQFQAFLWGRRSLVGPVVGAAWIGPAQAEYFA